MYAHRYTLDCSFQNFGNLQHPVILATLLQFDKIILGHKYNQCCEIPTCVLLCETFQASFMTTCVKLYYCNMCLLFYVINCFDSCAHSWVLCNMIVYICSEPDN